MRLTAVHNYHLELCSQFCHLQKVKLPWLKLKFPLPSPSFFSFHKNINKTQLYYFKGPSNFDNIKDILTRCLLSPVRSLKSKNYSHSINKCQDNWLLIGEGDTTFQNVPKKKKKTVDETKSYLQNKNKTINWRIHQKINL